MVDEYGERWEWKYGQYRLDSRDVRNWAVKLMKILMVLRKRVGTAPAATLALKKAMERVFEQYVKNPPTPNEFRACVLQQRPQAHKRFKSERLPKSTMEDNVRAAAEALPKVRECLGGGKLTRDQQNELYNQMRRPVVNPAMGE